MQTPFCFFTANSYYLHIQACFPNPNQCFISITIAILYTHRVFVCKLILVTFPSLSYSLYRHPTLSRRVYLQTSVVTSVAIYTDLSHVHVSETGNPCRVLEICPLHRRSTRHLYSKLHHQLKQFRHKPPLPPIVMHRLVALN